MRTVITVILMCSYATYVTPSIVLRCPSSEQQWNGRSKQFNCNGTIGCFYHCILDTEGILNETCVNRIKLKVGCPQVAFVNNTAHIADEKLPCPVEDKRCPSGESSFYSNELYKYPICLQQPETRTKIQISTKRVPNQDLRNSQNLLHLSNGCLAVNTLALCAIVLNSIMDDEFP